MAPPKVTVIGFCTDTTAQVFCCAEFDASRPAPVARLAWRAGGTSGVSDVPMTSAPPYAIGVHHLKDLPASAEVAYAIDIVNPDLARTRGLESGAASIAHRLRLLPSARPL